MRLYLIPISTRRTLLYCQKLDVASSGQQTWSEKIQAKVARTWTEWERKDKGWQKWVVNNGNHALRRIPYEEWGLKSVPPLSQRRREGEMKGTDKVEVLYPKSMFSTDKVPRVLETLATERQALHKKRLIWCFVGMPITAPIGLIPLCVTPIWPVWRP
jgi:Mitochondrial K+-H+ exchange-related